MYEHAIKKPLHVNHQNTWSIRRVIYGQTIVVQAEWIEGLQTWGMTCKINGELVDHRQADDPIKSAISMVEVAINNCEAMLDEDEQPSAPNALSASKIINDAAKRGGKDV